MTKDEVLKINLNDFGKYNDTSCPEISNGHYFYLDRCGVEIYCKDNVCSSAIRKDGNNSTVEFPDENGKMKSYIADVCVFNYSSMTSMAYEIDCSQAPECKSDSDCLSNKCEKNHCVRNDDIKIEKCQDTFHYHTLTFSSSIDMTCGKPDGYSCKSDGDCASSICDNNVCRFQGRDHTLVGLSSFFTYSIIILIIIIIAIIACCICCCSKWGKKNSRSAAAANDV